MNECKPVISTGLSVLTSSTEEGGEIRDQIPNSACEKDRNEGALLPGAGHTQFPRCQQSSLEEGVSGGPRITEENCDRTST